MCDPQRKDEDDDEVYHQRGGNTNDRDDLNNHTTALRGEEDKYRVEKTDQGPRRDSFEELIVVPRSAYEFAKNSPGYDSCT